VSGERDISVDKPGAGRGWRKRGLTDAEKALARRVFGDRIELDSIRFIGSPKPFDRAFVAGRWFGRDWIVWPNTTLADDYTTQKLSRRATFIHELVHVWQAQVQDYDIGWLLGSVLQGLLGRADGIDLKVGPFQRRADELLNRKLVFDQ